MGTLPDPVTKVTGLLRDALTDVTVNTQYTPGDLTRPATVVVLSNGGDTPYIGKVDAPQFEIATYSTVSRAASALLGNRAAQALQDAFEANTIMGVAVVSRPSEERLDGMPPGCYRHSMLVQLWLRPE